MDDFELEEALSFPFEFEDEVDDPGGGGGSPCWKKVWWGSRTIPVLELLEVKEDDDDKSGEGDVEDPEGMHRRC